MKNGTSMTQGTTMRIGFFVHMFPKISETFILNEIVGVVDRGHEVAIIADEKGNGRLLHPDVKRYGLIGRTSYLPWAHGLQLIRRFRHVVGWEDRIRIVSRRSTWMDERFARRPGAVLARAAQLMARKPYDIIHCHFGPLGRFAMALRDLGAIRGKLVTSFRGYDASSYVRTYGTAVYRRLFDRGELFLANSEYIRGRLIELGCDERKIVVHREGINCQIFQPRSRSCDASEPVRIVTIGRLALKKGVDDGIRAVAKLAKTGQRMAYDIVGDGSLRPELERLIHELGVERIVRLHGWRRQPEVVEILHNAQILLAPSVTSSDGNEEGIPNVLKEAMAIGLPVVATRHAGIPELVEDGVSGFLVPEHDVEALTEKLAFVMRHPECWLSVGRAGRARVEAEYDSARLNEQLIEIYRGLLRSDGARTTVR